VPSELAPEPHRHVVVERGQGADRRPPVDDIDQERREPIDEVIVECGSDLEGM